MTICDGYYLVGMLLGYWMAIAGWFVLDMKQRRDRKRRMNDELERLRRLEEIKRIFEGEKK